VAEGWRLIDRDPAAALRLAVGLPAGPDAALLAAAARRRLGEVAAARDGLQPFLQQGVPDPAAWFEWAAILAAAGSHHEAKVALERAVTLAPGFAAAWRSLGDVLLVLGAGAAAGAAYIRATCAGVQEPRLAEGAAALRAGRWDVAERILLPQVRAFPGDAQGLHLLAEAALRVGRVVEAEAVLAECLRLAPGFLAARHSLAVLLYVERRFDEAAAVFEALLAAAPHQPLLLVLRATSLVRVGDFAAAVAIFEAQLAAYRDQPELWLQYGHALAALGRGDAAAAAYRTCIGLAPGRCAGAYLSLADVKTAPITAAEIGAMREYAARPRVAPAEAAQLQYAMGQALEQRGDYAAAFGHFAAGARLRRAVRRYDADEVEGTVAACRAVFDAAFFAARAGVGCQEAGPIFVVGLPRSGSTLVEQILASHSAVEGTAELEEIGLIAAELRGGRPLAALPAIVAGLDGATLARLGARYLARTRQFRRLGRLLFIDKMPGNILHVALIHLILPRARIVEVRRSPMAAGFAAFKQHFQLGQDWAEYTFDLTDIGRYQRGTVALMAHVDAVLPGRVHHVSYETLVTDTEASVRALLASCGLAFEPGCLRFWETARAVQTPSAQQVRMPIFRDGLDRWRPYAPFLGELRAALGPLAEDNGVAAVG
jgi:tetratricopeptide (TPR) repeat protein